MSLLAPFLIFLAALGWSVHTLGLAVWASTEKRGAVRLLSLPAAWRRAGLVVAELAACVGGVWLLVVTLRRMGELA